MSDTPCYKLVQEEDIDLFETEVNRLLGEGFVVSGSLVIKNYKLIQPMTKNVYHQVRVEGSLLNRY